jgi:hypothetical protein
MPWPKKTDSMDGPPTGAAWVAAESLGRTEGHAEGKQQKARRCSQTNSDAEGMRDRTTGETDATGWRSALAKN